MERDVELAVRTGQIPDFGGRQGRGIVAEGQPTRHRLGSDPRIEFLQRRREPGQVLLACLRRQVDIPCRWYRGLLRNGGKGAEPLGQADFPEERYQEPGTSAPDA